MISTSTQFGVDLANTIIPAMLNQINESTKQFYQTIWNILLTFLSQHLLFVSTALVLIILLAITEYLTTGKWRRLGSVLYWYLYFGVLFIIGLIAGPNVFVQDIFHLISTLVINPLCYWIVRVILNETGIRNRYA